MKLGLSMWSFVAPWRRGLTDVPGFMRKAKALGVEGVELLDFFFRNRTNWEPETVHILRVRDEISLPIGVFSVGNSFSEPDADKRKEQVFVIRRGVDQALAFGTNVVRVFAGGAIPNFPADQVFTWFIEGLSESALYAAEKGVRLALENHGLLAGRSEQVIELIERVRKATGANALGANLDTGNFLLAGQDPVEAVSDLAAHAVMCHFKDFAPAPRGYRGPCFTAADGSEYIGTPIGEGQVDLAGCLAGLRAGGFDGWLNIEYESEEDPEAGVPRSLANARKYLQRLS